MKSSLPFFCLILVAVSCSEPKRTSRHTTYCACEHTINGKQQKLDIASENVELIFEELLDAIGLPSRPYNLCAVKQEGTVAFAKLSLGRFGVFVNPDHANDPELYLKYVMAHEIAHLLHGHVLYNTSHLEDASEMLEETEADEYAGYILAMAGVDYPDIARLLKEEYGQYQGSDSDPSTKQTIEAIARGYTKAGNISTTSILN